MQNSFIPQKSKNTIFLRSNEFQEVCAAFAKSQRIPRIYFVSSNIAKIFHIQHLFNLYGLPLRVYNQMIQAYRENHQLSPVASVKQSILDVTKDLDRLGLFFIEDSSFVLYALSSEGSEVPSLTTKDFLKKHPFPKIDKILRSKGNNRRAKLISLIGLHLPGGFGSEVFTGTVEGYIAEEYTPMQQASGIPWLDEQSPANYFIPDGANTPLSDLPLEISYNFDTRFKAINKMLFRLAQFAILTEYSNITLARKIFYPYEKQLSIFQPQVLLISGYSGAGKTTAALYLSRKYQMQYFEESDAVRSAAAESNWSSDDLVCFCQNKVAEQGPLCFIRYLLSMHNHSLAKPFIISGIRTPDEVDYLKINFPTSKLIFIDAPFELRFGRRCLAGYCHPEQQDEFRKLTNQESVWGMEMVRKKADFFISNVGSLQKLFSDLDKLCKIQ